MLQLTKCAAINQMVLQPNDAVIKFTKGCCNLPKGAAIIQMVLQLTKWCCNLPNDAAIYQMVLQLTKWCCN